jgi:hypothetical protein
MISHVGRQRSLAFGQRLFPELVLLVTARFEDDIVLYVLYNRLQRAHICMMNFLNIYFIS